LKRNSKATVAIVPPFSDTFVRITEFLDFVQCPEFKMLENTTFWKLDQFLSSGEGSVGSLGKN
jgi:hypothetical protein